jgi:hypothetical protein
MNPLVVTTRVGLSCGEFYLFDDLWHDLKVNFLGVNRAALRPLELCCLDLFSGCKIAWGCKAMVETDDGGRQTISEKNMRFLLAHILYNIGYRREGTTLVVEHGTAAIREKMEENILRLTGGAVTVSRSGIQGSPALLGWYKGRGKGNFRFKGALESHHNLVHNVTQCLPGQIGKDRDHAPEDLHGRDQGNALLVKAIERLPAERRDLLRWPYLQFQQFVEILSEIYRYINGRTEHRLEGFLEAGLTVQEFRLLPDSKHWLPASHVEKLPDQSRAAVMALAERPGMSRCRMMSPTEVWQRRSALVKIGAWGLPDIIGADLAVERRVKENGCFEFEDREICPGRLRYLARAMNAQGHEILLKDGETYQTFCNPFDLRELVVCDAKGGFLGVCKRLENTCRNDLEGLKRAMGAAAHAEKVRLDPYRARHAGEVEAKQADEEHNALVLAGAAMLPAEKRRERIEQETEFDLADAASARKAEGGNLKDEQEFSAEDIAAVLRKE